MYDVMDNGYWLWSWHTILIFVLNNQNDGEFSVVNKIINIILYNIM